MRNSCTVRLRGASGALVVALEGNPTTGYTWTVEGVDAAVLRVDGQPEFQAAGEALGSPGVVVLRFSPVGPGSTRLRLAYRRPWEDGVPPLHTFEVTVEVP